MREIYYFLTMFPIIYELILLVNPETVNEFFEKWRESKDVTGWKEWVYSIFNMLYFFWILIGMASSIWFAFLLLVVTFLLRLHWENRTIGRRLCSLLSLVILVYIWLS